MKWVHVDLEDKLGENRKQFSLDGVNSIPVKYSGLLLRQLLRCLKYNVKLTIQFVV